MLAKRFFYVCAGLLCLAPLTAESQVFQDDFDGGALDPAVWSVDLGTGGQVVVADGGIQDTIPVVALLCRTGHVLDAYVPPSYVNPGDLQPIQHDPKMVQAAIASVRQYVFTPAMKSGQAIAVWITVPVAFRH